MARSEVALNLGAGPLRLDGEIGVDLYPVAGADVQADLVALAREMLYTPNWTMDAAQKLGLDPDFNAVPPPMAYWLERRRVTAKDVVPSTFGAAGSR